MGNKSRTPSQYVKTYSCVETVASVFAFINLVAAGLCILICMSFLVFYFLERLIGNDTVEEIWYLALVVNVGVLVTFVFAVLLYLGIYKTKPGLVLAYFIFGVIVDIALMCAVIALHYTSLTKDIDYKAGPMWELFDEYYEPIAHGILGICVIYTLVLSILCRTWFVMRSRRSEDRQKLSNYYEYDTDWRYE